MAERPGIAVSRLAWLAALLAFYLLAVHLPEPRTASVLPMFLLLLVLPGHLVGDALETAGWALILAPAAVVFLGACAWGRSRPAGSVLGFLSAAFVAFAALDLPIQALLAGLGMESAAQVGFIVALSTLAWAVLLRSLSRDAMGLPAFEPRVVRGLAVAVILGVSAWSWAVMAAAWRSATVLADGAPYCIAVSSGGPEDYVPISSALRLRGTKFFTEHSGHKDASRWFFNGVLVVQGTDGHRFHNWSYRSWRFELLPRHGTRFIARIDRACTPMPGFLPSRLP
jgi:hypothetical protein